MSEENGIGGGGRKRIDNDCGTTKQASGKMYKKRTRDVKSKKQSNKGIEVSDSHCFHCNCIVSYLHCIACKEGYCDSFQMVPLSIGLISVQIRNDMGSSEPRIRIWKIFWIKILYSFDIFCKIIFFWPRIQDWI